MGLDSAFIVDQSARNGKTRIKTVHVMRKQHPMHNRIMLMLAPGERDEDKPDLVSSDEDGYEGSCNHWHELTEDEVRQLFGTTCFTIDAKRFMVEDPAFGEHAVEANRLAAIVKLFDDYYPSAGDKLYYAWSE